MRHETQHNTKIRYAFFGTPRFAAHILETLIAVGLSPNILVANQDSPVGRKKIVTPPLTKLVAQQTSVGNGITVLQPNILDSAFVAQLEAAQLDLCVVAAYSKIIPKSVLAIPRLGMFGIHPSLLPKHRGPSPIQVAILDADTATGVTIYQMDEKIDHGPIIAKAVLSPWDPARATYLETEEKLSTLGGKLIAEALPRIAQNGVVSVPQNEHEATYTKKFTSADGYVSPGEFSNATDGNHPETAVLVDRKVRALSPEPGVWTMNDGRRMKLLSGALREGAFQPLMIQFEGEKPKPFRS